MELSRTINSDKRYYLDENTIDSQKELKKYYSTTITADLKTRDEKIKMIQEALDNGCGYDAPGSFAAWLSKQTPMHAYVMPGKRYDIGDINSYEYVKSVFSK